MRKGLAWAVLVAAVIASADCGAKAPDISEVPTTLRFAYNPASDDIQISQKRYRALADYLTKAMGMPVELSEAASYSAMMEALRSAKVDAGSMGPLSYVIAAQHGGIEPVAVPGRAEGPGSYQSAIFVRADSPVKTVEDLMRDAGRYTFSFVDPASTSGHLLPRAYFDSIGFDPEKGFRKVHFAGAHVTALYNVLGGKVDAAASMPRMLQALAERGQLKEGDLRILWQSPDIPQNPIVVRSALPDSFKKKVQKAFLDLAATEPQLAQQMQVGTPYQDFRYHAASDALYEGLRKMARNLKNLRMVD